MGLIEMVDREFTYTKRALGRVLIEGNIVAFLMDYGIRRYRGCNPAEAFQTTLDEHGL